MMSRNFTYILVPTCLLYIGKKTSLGIIGVVLIEKLCRFIVNILRVLVASTNINYHIFISVAG